jgi:hypothetical protein
MNEVARIGGYFVDVSKLENDSFTIKIGKGFIKETNKDAFYIIRYDDEFCTLFEVLDGVEKQKIKRDISSEVRSGVDPLAFMQRLKGGLIDKLCANYNIDKSYVYYEKE